MIPPLILDNFGTTCTFISFSLLLSARSLPIRNSDQMFQRIKLCHIIIHTIFIFHIYEWVWKMKKSHKNIKKPLQLYLRPRICQKKREILDIDTWRMIHDGPRWQLQIICSQCQFFYDIIIRMLCICKRVKELHIISITFMYENFIARWTCIEHNIDERKSVKIFITTL